MPTTHAYATKQRPFDWKGAMFRWTLRESETYAQERGLTPLVFEQLRDRGYIGYCLFGSFRQHCFAVPFRDADGEVFRAQCRAPKRDQNGHMAWRYEPSSDQLNRPIPPWIVGDAHSDRVFLSESHMDLIALIDRGGFMPDIDDNWSRSSPLVARAEIGKLKGLAWAQGVEIFLVPQNDPDGQTWLAKVLRILSGFEPGS